MSKLKADKPAARARHTPRIDPSSKALPRRAAGRATSTGRPNITTSMKVATLIMLTLMAATLNAKSRADEPNGATLDSTNNHATSHASRPSATVTNVHSETTCDMPRPMDASWRNSIDDGTAMEAHRLHDQALPLSAPNPAGTVNSSTTAPRDVEDHRTSTRGRLTKHSPYQTYRTSDKPSGIHGHSTAPPEFQGTKPPELHSSSPPGTEKVMPKVRPTVTKANPRDAPPPLFSEEAIETSLTSDCTPHDPSTGHTLFSEADAGVTADKKDGHTIVIGTKLPTSPLDPHTGGEAKRPTRGRTVLETISNHAMAVIHFGMKSTTYFVGPPRLLRRPNVQPPVVFAVLISHLGYANSMPTRKKGTTPKGDGPKPDTGKPTEQAAVDAELMDYEAADGEEQFSANEISELYDDTDADASATPKAPTEETLTENKEEPPPCLLQVPSGSFLHPRGCPWGVTNQETGPQPPGWSATPGETNKAVATDSSSNGDGNDAVSAAVSTVAVSADSGSTDPKPVPTAAAVVTGREGETAKPPEGTEQKTGKETCEQNDNAETIRLTVQTDNVETIRQTIQTVLPALRRNQADLEEVINLLLLTNAEIREEGGHDSPSLTQLNLYIIMYRAGLCLPTMQHMASIKTLLDALSAKMNTAGSSTSHAADASLPNIGTSAANIAAAAPTMSTTSPGATPMEGITEDASQSPSYSPQPSPEHDQSYAPWKGKGKGKGKDPPGKGPTSAHGKGKGKGKDKGKDRSDTTWQDPFAKKQKTTSWNPNADPPQNTVPVPYNAAAGASYPYHPWNSVPVSITWTEQELNIIPPEANYPILELVQWSMNPNMQAAFLLWPDATTAEASDNSRPQPWIIPHVTPVNPAAAQILEELLFMGFSHANPTIKTTHQTKTSKSPEPPHVARHIFQRIQNEFVYHEYTAKMLAGRYYDTYILTHNIIIKPISAVAQARDRSLVLDAQVWFEHIRNLCAIHAIDWLTFHKAYIRALLRYLAENAKLKLYLPRWRHREPPDEPPNGPHGPNGGGSGGGSGSSGGSSGKGTGGNNEGWGNSGYSSHRHAPNGGMTNQGWGSYGAGGSRCTPTATGGRYATPDKPNPHPLNHDGRTTPLTQVNSTKGLTPSTHQLTGGTENPPDDKPAQRIHAQPRLTDTTALNVSEQSRRVCAFVSPTIYEEQTRDTRTSTHQHEDIPTDVFGTCSHGKLDGTTWANTATATASSATLPPPLPSPPTSSSLSLLPSSSSKSPLAHPPSSTSPSPAPPPLPSQPLPMPPSPPASMKIQQNRVNVHHSNQGSRTIISNNNATCGIVARQKTAAQRSDAPHLAPATGAPVGIVAMSIYSVYAMLPQPPPDPPYEREPPRETPTYHHSTHSEQSPFSEHQHHHSTHNGSHGSHSGQQSHHGGQYAEMYPMGYDPDEEERRRRHYAAERHMHQQSTRFVNGPGYWNQYPDPESWDGRQFQAHRASPYPPPWTGPHPDHRWGYDPIRQREERTEWQSLWERDNGPQLYDWHGMPAPQGPVQRHPYSRFRHNPYRHQEPWHTPHNGSPHLGWRRTNAVPIVSPSQEDNSGFSPAAKSIKPEEVTPLRQPSSPHAPPQNTNPAAVKLETNPEPAAELAPLRSLNPAAEGFRHPKPPSPRTDGNAAPHTQPAEATHPQTSRTHTPAAKRACFGDDRSVTHATAPTDSTTSTHAATTTSLTAPTTGDSLLTLHTQRPCGDPRQQQELTATAKALAETQALSDEAFGARAPPPSTEPSRHQQADSTLTSVTASKVIEAWPFTGIAATSTEAGTSYYTIPQPDDRIKVFPPKVAPPANPTKPVLYSVPKPIAGSPVILLGQTGDYATHIIGIPANGHYAKCSDRVPALLVIMQHFLVHKPPASLCLNCYSHHAPKPCPDAARDFQALIDAAASLPPHDKRHYKYKGCPTCRLHHAPTRGLCSA